MKAIGKGFYTHLTRACTLSLKLGYTPYVWKIAVLSIHIKPHKPPSQKTSLRPIILLSAIMKLLEQAINNAFGNTSKTRVSLVSISQTLENRSQQTITLSISPR